MSLESLIYFALAGTIYIGSNTFRGDGSVTALSLFALFQFVGGMFAAWAIALILVP